MHFHEHFQIEISSKCDIKAENSSTLSKFHKKRKGLQPMGCNADRLPEWQAELSQIVIIIIIIIIIYIALFNYSFIALYNDQVNVEPKS